MPRNNFVRFASIVIIALTLLASNFRPGNRYCICIHPTTRAKGKNSCVLYTSTRHVNCDILAIMHTSITGCISFTPHGKIKGMTGKHTHAGKKADYSSRVLIVQRGESTPPRGTTSKSRRLYVPSVYQQPCAIYATRADGNIGRIYSAVHSKKRATRKNITVVTSYTAHWPPNYFKNAPPVNSKSCVIQESKQRLGGVCVPPVLTIHHFSETAMLARQRPHASKKSCLFMILVSQSCLLSKKGKRWKRYDSNLRRLLRLHAPR